MKGEGIWSGWTKYYKHRAFYYRRTEIYTAVVTCFWGTWEVTTYKSSGKFDNCTWFDNEVDAYNYAMAEIRRSDIVT
jgi:hypothetical protein